MRLQGGPFDGERLFAEGFSEPPAMLWIERAGQGALSVSDRPTPQGEKYRRSDEARDGEHIYIFTDMQLGGGGRGNPIVVDLGDAPPPPAKRERELVPA